MKNPYSGSSYSPRDPYTGRVSGKWNAPASSLQLPPAPHSEEAEMGVVSSMLQSPAEAIRVCLAKITANHFFVPAHRTVFEALIDRWDSGEAIDLITFTQFLRDRNELEKVGGAAFVTSLQTFATATMVEHYIGIVCEKYELRQIILAGTEMVRRAHDVQDGETGVLLDEAESRIASIRSLDSSDSPEAVSIIAPEAGEFPLDALNPTMKQIAEETAETYQVDVAVPAMGALATFAACPGKRVTLTGAASGRVTHANLYAVIGAPKSYGKNGAGTVLAPFSDASRELTDHFWKVERPRLRAERKIKEAKEKRLLAEISTEGDTEERRKELEAIEARLAEIADLDARLPTRTVGNATTAALYEILRRNDETIFSYALEAGDLIRIILGKFNKGDAADFDLYLSGYTVEVARQSRISRDDSGDLVPCISVLWFCQPFLLRELYANEEALERELTARVLPFIVERDIIPEEDDKERSVNTVTEGAWENLVQNALALRTHSYQIECSSEARQVLRDFHNEAVALRNGKYRDIEGELGRWRENAARIAAGQFTADALTKGRMRPFEKLILSGEQAERGVRIARWSHLHSIAMLNRGMTERQWQRVETLRSLLVTRYSGQATLRDLNLRHGFASHEVKALAGEYPKMLSVKVAKPQTGRPSEILTFTK
jgi:Protein of unknown function (DUF3987)/DnaB-like helicase N terminal domain